MTFPSAVAALVLLVSLGVSLGSALERGDRIEWTHISPHKVAGLFLTTDNLGLRFESTSHTLLLHSLDGQELLHIFPKDASSTSLADFHYHYLGNPIIPDPFLSIEDIASDFILGQGGHFLPRIYKVMEHLGIKGPEMPGAMGIFKIALGVQRYTDKFLLPPTQCNCPSTITLEQCRTPPNSPPQCCDCLGQCGSCGSCWTSVCGDCCWHLGCCGHDICCYSSSVSCLFPINFSCTGSYTCSGYDTSCCNTKPYGKANLCDTENFGFTCNKTICCSTGWTC